MVYDIIVFEYLRFLPSTRKREAGVLENLHSGGGLLKRCVLGDRFHQIRVGGTPKRMKKISVFKQKGIRVDGA